MVLLLFVVVGFLSALASAVFGFGTALFFLAIGSHLLDVKDTIVLATVLFAASTITKSILYGRHVDWRIVGVMAVSCLPFAYGGSLLLAHVPGDLVKRLLGSMVLCYVILKHIGRLPAVRIGWRGLVVGSALYGFVSGLVGSGNLIKVIMFREMQISRQAFVGAMAATSVMSNLAKLSGYWQSGLLTADMSEPAAALVVSAIAAALLGRFVLNRISADSFETGLQILMVIAALALIF
nr:sulfite exporter TauE/SafE family protein [uncultured Cohaesibacter sp.]